MAYIDMKSFKDMKAILFDIGDTIVQTAPIINNSIFQAATKLRHKVGIKSIDNFIQTYKQIDSIIQGININHLYSDPLIISRTFDLLDINVDDLDILTFLIYYRDEVRKHLTVDIRVVELFDFLKSKNYKLGIVSDGTTIEQLETLNRLGILNHFDTFAISQHVGVEKPHPQIFLHAIDKLQGIDISEIAMVGNDLDRDIKGASHFGMYTIFVSNKGQQSLIKSAINPSMEITSIFELFNL